LQTTLSLHAALLGVCVHMPCGATQASTVQVTPSLQLIGVPATQVWFGPQVSTPLQALPSSHVPQLPPQPSSPQVAPWQFGMQAQSVEAHSPFSVHTLSGPVHIAWVTLSVQPWFSPLVSQQEPNDSLIATLPHPLAAILAKPELGAGTFV
jgi:hypothetical protein